MTHPALTAPLGDGELAITGRLLQASNATFLAELAGAAGRSSASTSRPRANARSGTFRTAPSGYREVAAYEVSRLGGFDCVPVTVFVDGPLGPGSLQAWVDVDEDGDRTAGRSGAQRGGPGEGWFSCVQGLDADDRPVTVIHADAPELRMLAVFDVLINNADRKGGHILGSGGRVFGVDHGVCFHTDHKLRTLLWGWAGRELDERELNAVRQARDEAPDRLAELISEPEVAAFVRRADLLLQPQTAAPPARGVALDPVAALLTRPGPDRVAPMQAWNARPMPTPGRPVGPATGPGLRHVAAGWCRSGRRPGRARMYVCGITPYDATHIGHANTYVAFDLLHRVWRDAGLEVDYVQNVTDVDDPLLDRARETGVDWPALAEQQIQLYREDMAALNVLPPRHSGRRGRGHSARSSS